MESPFFSIVITTCRGDKPFIHNDWNLLDKIVENCQKQTFKNFELIIVDLLYDYRADHFKDVIGKLDFPLLHIVDKDSIFRDLMLVRICSARNTGLLFARGKHIIFSDDGQEWSEQALDQLKSWAMNGIGATCRLFRDNGYGPYEIDSRWAAYKMEGTLRTKVVSADGVGYLGGTLSMVPMEAMLKCNGWDEMFDGSRQLEDSDMARRLGAAGLRMALDGHPRVVEYKMRGCDSQKFRNGIFVKCNGAYIYPMWDKDPKRIVANDRLLTDEELDSFILGKCRKLDAKLRCTVSKDECKGNWKRRSLMKIYQDQRLVFDIRKLREARSWDNVENDSILNGE